MYLAIAESFHTLLKQAFRQCRALSPENAISVLEFNKQSVHSFPSQLGKFISKSFRTSVPWFYALIPISYIRFRPDSNFEKGSNSVFVFLLEEENLQPDSNSIISGTENMQPLIAVDKDDDYISQGRKEEIEEGEIEEEEVRELDPRELQLLLKLTDIKGAQKISVQDLPKVTVPRKTEQILAINLVISL